MSYDLYDYNIKIFFEEPDNDYVAFIEEIPECSAFGSTAESALGELEIAFEGWMEAVEKRGYPVPEPRNVLDLDNKLSVFLPRNIHKQIIEKAIKDNVSLNQEIISCLNRGLFA